MVPFDTFSTRVYVVGEVLVSLVLLIGCGLLVFYSPDEGVKIAAGTATGAVTTFWFSRRMGEQSTNAITTIANGKLTALMAKMDSLSSLYLPPPPVPQAPPAQPK